MRGSNGFGVIVGTLLPARPGKHARAFIEAEGPEGLVRYSVDANLSGEGIHANFGRFGRVALRWVPNGNVREVSGTCDHYPWHQFFESGAYVGTVRFRGGNGFTVLHAHRIPWRRDWYGPHAPCGIGVSEGFPGPGAILEAGHANHFYGRVHLFVVQNGAGAEVRYDVEEFEQAGRIAVARDAFTIGGPKTITVGPGLSHRRNLAAIPRLR